MIAGASAVAGRRPWLAAGLTVSAAFAYCVPGLAPWLAFDTGASHSGQWWRFLTGHFCHFNGSHFVGDVGAFFIWAAVVEMLSRRLLIHAVLGTALCVGLWLTNSPSRFVEYRGLSAIDCALAAQLFTLAFFDSTIRRSRWLLSALTLASALFIAKTCFEFASGHAVLAPKLGHGVKLLPQVHVLGIATGVSTAFMHAVRLGCKGSVDDEPMPGTA